MNSSSEKWKQAFLSQKKFDETESYKTLQTCIKNAPDLTNPNTLSPERIQSYICRALSFTLYYGFEQVNEEIMQKLFDLADERNVIEQMQLMQQGYPINWIEGIESENRAVLHTALRKEKEEYPLEKEIVEKSHREKEKLERLLEEISSSFTTILFIGIGGSELGPHAICEALKRYWKKGKKVFYAGNVDPDELSLIFEQIEPKETIVVIVSKSGTTLETSTNEERVRSYFEERVDSVQNHMIAVTCPNTPMDSSKRYRATLYLFDSIGGRYSTTSMVGGILIGFIGGIALFKEFLMGAAAMDKIALLPSPQENLPLLMALLGVWNRSFLGYPTVAIIPYSSLLHRFPAHLQQCDMESNGKKVLRTGSFASYPTGPIIWGEPGTNAQHSFFQLLHQGTETIPVEFIGFYTSQFKKDISYKKTTSQDKLLANMFAQALALAKGQTQPNINKQFFGNRPSRILLGKEITAYTIGQLLALYEHKIAFQGFLWGINSFDQEGVQLGKTLSEKLLQIKSNPTLPHNSTSLEEAIEQILQKEKFS